MDGSKINDLKQQECTKHLKENFIAVCLDSNCDHPIPFCCVKCLFEHYPVCKQEQIVSFDAMAKTLAVDPELVDFNKKLNEVLEEHEKEILPRLKSLQNIITKIDSDDKQTLSENLVKTDIGLLKNCYEKTWNQENKQLVLVKNEVFLTELKEAFDDFKTRVLYLFEGNFVNEARDLAEKKKLKHLSQEGPQIKKQELETLKFFMASKTEVYKFVGGAKLEIPEIERLVLKYEANSDFTFVINQPYQKINLKIRYSLFPKREVIMFYMVPKDYKNFYTLSAPPANFCEGLCWLKFESVNLAGTKLLTEKGMNFTFDQSRKRLGLFIQEKEISSEIENNIKADVDYVLLMNFKNKEPNNVYFYIQ